MPARSSSGEIQVECNDLIVSKTDLDSRITYANKAFCYYSGFREKELLGQPQNIVRHSDMPRAIFYLMWEHLKQDQEFFGYVKNHRKDGGYYWTFASVAPVYENGQKTGYLSARRCPGESAIQVIEPLYQKMIELEKSLPKEQQIPMSSAILWKAINKEFATYAEFALSL
ncbi:PAS domain S-box protein [Bacterioplanoides sp. SCSIO 12839]|uniref:PAS domain-containing protein n=1 Tax=Bacterioplanoides sp. SCSIO 12839 TaxID=2829569 RepID=UPI0021083400|nr:PAS domain S-box protein [Bacterioplanoides sp. SCSIO 12839]UTW47262.1 PAS domain S-box protein [Bacterioplanoides sp. SCSIO 12839]